MRAAQEKIESLEREKQEVEDEALARTLQAESTPSDSSSPGGGFTVCGICFDRPADHVYNPCGHVTCASCFESRQIRPHECPFCRVAHHGIIPIHHVSDEAVAPASPSVTSAPSRFSSTQPLPQSAPMPPSHMMMPPPYMMLPPPHMMMQMMMVPQPMQQPQEPQRESPAVNRRRER